MTRKNAAKRLTREDIRRVIFEERTRGSLKEALALLGVTRQSYYHACRQQRSMPRVVVNTVAPLVATVRVTE